MTVKIGIRMLEALFSCPLDTIPFPRRLLDRPQSQLDEILGIAREDAKTLSRFSAAHFNVVW